MKVIIDLSEKQLKKLELLSTVKILHKDKNTNLIEVYDNSIELAITEILNKIYIKKGKIYYG